MGELAACGQLPGAERASFNLVTVEGKPWRDLNTAQRPRPFWRPEGCRRAQPPDVSTRSQRNAKSQADTVLEAY